METRIVTLTPEGASIRTEPYDFEDALIEFEDFSEARGKRKAKSQARKIDRIAKRKEKKLARIQARDEVRSARKQKRIGRKASAQKARQEKRQLATERRQVRKMTRKKGRVERKQLADEPGAEMDDQTAIEMDDQVTQGPPPRTLPPNFREEPNQGGEDEYTDSGNYGDSSGSTIYAEEEETTPYGNDEQYYEEDEYYPTEYDDVGEGEGDEVYSEDESNFVGEIGNKKVNSNFLKIAQKIEWNKELILRLEFQKLNLAKDLSKTPVGGRAEQIKMQINKIDKDIKERQGRIRVLENMLISASNFSGADGQIETARKMAKRLRAKISLANKGKIGKRKVANGGDVFPVDFDLNPDIRTNYVKIPSKSNFTGLIGIDDKDAYDADEPRIYEIKSSVDGASEFAKNSALRKMETANKVAIVCLSGLFIYGLVKAFQNFK